MSAAAAAASAAARTPATTRRREDDDAPVPDHLLCSVCLDAPDGNVYQCCNSHLLCEGCLHQLRARGALAGQAPTCPTCRATLSDGMSRSRVAERAIALLPATCRYCLNETTRGELVNHEANCPSAPDVQCCRHVDGCEWIGRESERGTHEAGCAIVRLCAKFDVERRETVDVMDALLRTETMSAQERKNEALRRAAEYGLATLVERLIAGGGADVDGARSDDGVTPLMLACRNGHMATVELLVAAGSRVDKANTAHGSNAVVHRRAEKPA